MKIKLSESIELHDFKKIQTTMEAVDYCQKLNEYLKILEVALSQRIRKEIELKNLLPQFGSFKLNINEVSTYRAFGAIGNFSEEQFHVENYLRINSKAGRLFMSIQFTTLGDWKNSSLVEYSVYRGQVYPDYLARHCDYPEEVLQMIIEEHLDKLIQNGFHRYGKIADLFNQYIWWMAERHQQFPLYDLKEKSENDTWMTEIDDKIGLSI